MSSHIPSNVFSSLAPEHVELLRTTVAKGASEEQLKLFLFIAERAGLDPFTRQIHLVKRGASVVVQTGIDGYRAIASRTGQHAGTDDAIFLIENGVPQAATVTVYRLIGGHRCAFTATARWVEYKQEFNGKLVGLWEKMPFQMLAKCAESLALRKAFPNELSGLYTHEEMSQADRESSAGVLVDDASREPVESQMTLGEYKRAIVEKIQERGERLSTLEEYRNYVFEHTGMELIPENYREILARLV